MARRSLLFCLFWSFVALSGAGRARADTVTIAVAANFVRPLEALQREFEKDHDHRLTIVSGSTGQLYAQITNAAPFDVLLSADTEHPDRLVAAGLGDGAQRFTYAIGKLTLFTRDVAKFEPLDMKSLARADYRWLAIANPDLAPYGLAAEQALRKLGLWDSLQNRIVRGQSIAQTFAMVETRNADLALVAASQAIEYDGSAAHVDVPGELYEPIRQDAVLLKHGASNAAARAFLAFLASAQARDVIGRFGYSRP